MPLIVPLIFFFPPRLPVSNPISTLFLFSNPHDCLVPKILCNITMKSTWNMINFLKFGVEAFQNGLTLHLYQDLSYGEILTGRPEAWLVKKIFFICMQ